MSLLSKAGLLNRIRKSKESRRRLVDSNLDKGIAFQIRATREARGWSQSDLALKSEMAQNNISRLESPEYGKHTISSLKRLADALDVALVVRFVTYSQYIDWLSGTPHLDDGLRPEALAVPSFEEENQNGRYETEVRYHPVFVTQEIRVHTTSFLTPISIQTPIHALQAGVSYDSETPIYALQAGVSYDSERQVS